MASSWYPTSGIPADSVGSDGDFARDAVARIDWGPKGRMTAGSWAGTAIAISGPTGQSILSGSGAPGSQLGQNGQSYFDAAAGTTYLKSSNAWTAVGTTIGPQGPVGPSILTSQSATHAPLLSIVSTAALTSTPSPWVFAGSSISNQVTYPFGSALMGLMAYNASSAAIVVNFVDVAAQSVLYTTNIASGAIVWLGQFSYTAYPMIQGRQYQWQVTGTAAAANSYLMPIYLMPAATPASGVSPLPFAGRASSTATYGSTYNSLYIPGSTAANFTYKPLKAASLYQVTCYNQTNASLTFGMANFTANNFLWNLGVVAAGATATFGPYSSTQYPFTVGSQYYWSASGSGTGPAFVDSQILYTVA